MRGIGKNHSNLHGATKSDSRPVGTEHQVNVREIFDTLGSVCNDATNNNPALREQSTRGNRLRNNVGPGAGQ